MKPPSDILDPHDFAATITRGPCHEPPGPAQFQLRIAVMAPEPWIRRWRSDGVRARHTVDGPGREWNGSLGCIPVSKGLESKYHIYIHTHSIILSYIILSCIVLYDIILY